MINKEELFEIGFVDKEPNVYEYYKESNHVPLISVSKDLKHFYLVTEVDMDYLHEFYPNNIKDVKKVIELFK